MNFRVRPMLDIIDPGGRQVRRREVDSSNVEWIGWPASGEPLMVIQFKNGGRYGYMPVSRQRTVAAAYAPSVGKYLHKRIIGRFKVVQLLSEQ